MIRLQDRIAGTLMTHRALKIIPSIKSKNWQEILSDLITDPKELLHILRLDINKKPVSLSALSQFPLKVPRPFVEAMQPNNWNDPLLLQIWPSKDEEISPSEYTSDPLYEVKFNPVAGLLHKYQARVLLTAAPHCAIHCRYCFRRHFDYQSNTPSREEWSNSLDYIKADPSIQEVILSGGDPLAISDKQLLWLIRELESISHLKILRIHSRVPIVLPQRITPQLIAMIDQSRFDVVMVVHCNHSQEVSDKVKQGIEALRLSKITLLNQSVVLAGINDDPEILKELSYTLFSLSILPYYLHLPDKVMGTSHFSVPPERAIRIINILRKELPGYLVPTLVQEEPGALSKTRLV